MGIGGKMTEKQFRKELQALHNMVCHDRRSQMLGDSFMLRSISLKLELLLKHVNVPKEEMVELESALKENSFDFTAACEKNREFYKKLMGNSEEAYTANREEQNEVEFKKCFET